MRSKFNIGILLIVAVLLVSNGIAVWELYRLQEVVDGELLAKISPAVSTIIIGTAVLAAMLLMLMLFFNIYYMRPVKRINRALKHYLTAHTPFNPSFDGDKELTDMRDMIERLVEQNKRSNKNTGTK